MTFNGDPDRRERIMGLERAEKAFTVAVGRLAEALGMEWEAPGFQEFVEQRRRLLYESSAVICGLAADRLQERVRDGNGNGAG